MFDVLIILKPTVLYNFDVETPVWNWACSTIKFRNRACNTIIFWNHESKAFPWVSLENLPVSSINLKRTIVLNFLQNFAKILNWQRGRHLKLWVKLYHLPSSREKHNPVEIRRCFLSKSYTSLLWNRVYGTKNCSLKSICKTIKIDTMRLKCKETENVLNALVKKRKIPLFYQHRKDEDRLTNKYV